MTVVQLETVHGKRTHGRLYREGDGWVISSIPPHIAIRFKQLFPRIPKAQSEHYRVHGGDDVAEDLLWFMVRYPLEVSPETMADLRNRRSRLDSVRAEADTISMPGWRPDKPANFRDGTAPYLYQAQAAALTRKLGRLLLMDDVGLGKTVSALATIVEAPKPCAVVAQAHLSEQWAAFVEEFTTLKAHIIKGTRPYRLPEADVYIFRYSNIGGWADVGGKGTFPTVVLDEMQELRTGQYTNKGMASAAFCRHAQVRMGLTATPIYNYGAEIWNIVRFLDETALGNWDDFVREWCTNGGSHSIVSDPVALGTYLRDLNLALRRTEADVGGEMPPVNTLPIVIAWDEDIAEADEAEARKLALAVVHGSFTESGRAARELDMLLRRLTGVVKAVPVATYVRMLIEAGEPVLLVGWHRDVYDIWLDKLSDLNPVMYTGTESPAAKRRTKEAFCSGETDLMIISLRSGIGLDGLQHRCHTVVFGELDWSPQVHRQVIGRLRRPGQKNQVDAVYCHTNGGSDPLVIEMLGLKASQAKGIVDPLSGVDQVYSDDSRLKRLAKDFLERGRHG